MQAESQLCTRCNLCCNGVLFADVRLPADADSARLRAAGIPVRRRGNACVFRQPCAALQANGCCRVYADRPAMCRQFECGLLKQVKTGELTEDAALRMIRRTQALAARVSRLLLESGNLREDLALTRRYQAVMRQPLDLADPAAGDRRGELMLAVHELMNLLHTRFLTG